MYSPESPEEDSKRRPLPVRVLFFFVAYIVGGYLGTRLLFPPFDAIAFWPPSGLMLGAFLTAGAGEGLLFVGAAIAASTFFEVYVHHHAPVLGAAFACANIIEAGVGNWFLRNFFGGCRGWGNRGTCCGW